MMICTLYYHCYKLWTGAGHTVNLDVRLAAKEVQLLWCNSWVGIHWKYVETKPELWWCTE